MIPGMPASPPKKPIPCSAAPHMNTPVVSIVNKSQVTEHSHDFEPITPE